MIFEVKSARITKTAAEWAVDFTIYGDNKILVTSDELYPGTDQPRFKFANGTEAWFALDYVPAGGADTNFANTNLEFTGDRAHDAFGYKLSVTDLAQLYFEATSAPVGQPAMRFNTPGMLAAQTDFQVTTAVGIAMQILGDLGISFPGRVGIATPPSATEYLKIAGSGFGVFVDTVAQAARYQSAAAVTAQYVNSMSFGTAIETTGYIGNLAGTNSNAGAVCFYGIPSNTATQYGALFGSMIMHKNYSVASLPPSPTPYAGNSAFLMVTDAGVNADETTLLRWNGTNWVDVRTQLPVAQSIGARPSPMTSAQRTAATPPAGTIVNDTTTNSAWRFDGTDWYEL